LGVVVDPNLRRDDLGLNYLPSSLFYPPQKPLPSQIQAAVLATPAETHYALAKKLLLKGLDVLVEKPLALRLKEAQELVLLAKEKKRILMVGHLLEYHPAVVKLEAMVRSGVLGRLRYISSNRLNLGTLRKKENVLWSFAPHDIGLILRLAGQLPKRVRCTGAAYLKKGIADVSLMQMSFTGSQEAFIYVNWLHPFKEQRLVVVGSERMATFCDVKKELKIYPCQARWQNGKPIVIRNQGKAVPFDPIPPLKLELRHFLDCVKTRNSPRTTGAHGANILRVLEAGEKSMRAKGKFVGVSSR